MTKPLREPLLVGYARVSTDDQDLALQRAALIKAGVREDRIYEEHASGGRMDRKALTFAMRPMIEGDTLMVWKLDRLGRTLPGVLEMLEEMKRRGLRFVSLTESFDTGTPIGEAMFRMALVFAELERKLISERTKAGIAAKKEAGVWKHRPHSIIDNPKRLNAARPLIESGQIDTMSAREIMEALNRADPDATPITAPETIRRWRRQGYRGID